MFVFAFFLIIFLSLALSFFLSLSLTTTLQTTLTRTLTLTLTPTQSLTLTLRLVGILFLKLIFHQHGCLSVPNDSEFHWERLNTNALMRKNGKREDTNHAR